MITVIRFDLSEQTFQNPTNPQVLVDRAAISSNIHHEDPEFFTYPTSS